MLTTFSISADGATLHPKVGDLESHEWHPFLVGNEQAGRFHVLEENKDPEHPVISGVWEHLVTDSPSGAFTMQQQENEVIYLIRGAAEITYTDGTVIKISAGDTFYFPKGSDVTWRTTKDLIKFFVLY